MILVLLGLHKFTDTLEFDNLGIKNWGMSFITLQYISIYII